MPKHVKQHHKARPKGAAKAKGVTASKALGGPSAFSLPGGPKATRKAHAQPPKRGLTPADHATRVHRALAEMAEIADPPGPETDARWLAVDRDIAEARHPGKNP